MLKPMDKDAAFAAIADDLELPLVLLANPDPRVRLAQLDKIGAVLLSTNLTFRDLAERVVGPRPVEDRTRATTPLPMSIVSLQPRSEIAIDPAAVLSNDELASDVSRTGPGTVHGEASAEADLPAMPVDPNKMATDKELQAYGYRSRGYGYGYDSSPIPNADPSEPPPK